jgi:proteasome accessory factor B
MSKQLFLSRYLLLVNRLEQGPATYEELKRILERASTTRDKKLATSRRTLQRDIKDIDDHFGIEIGNERQGDRRYFIKEAHTVRTKEDRLLEAYRTVSIIQNAQQYASLIFPESRRIAGLEHFHGLLYATREKRITEFTYTKFGEAGQSKRRVQPLALKEAQHRWYLVGIDEKDQRLKTFGLDRISELELTRQNSSHLLH